MNIANLFTPAKLRAYIQTLHSKNASVSSVKRKLTSVLKLAQWAKKTGKITAQEYSIFEQELSVQRSKILGNATTKKNNISTLSTQQKAPISSHNPVRTFMLGLLNNIKARNLLPLFL
ncbi:hypothetical protein COU88_03795, partial [Candidatus Roizmanbacteria bacterium CG10_big_fil_rev_8_21_14_0_10_39_6]